MPEVILAGAAGRIEARYSAGKTENAPIALILHPHPKAGGHMNNPVTVQLFHLFMTRGFSVLRFNFRGVQKSQGEFDSGIGELADAATALDWLQAKNPTASQFWVAGYDFGAYIGMQLLMRRPETDGFISVSPPTNAYYFSFLAPCRASGMFLHGGMIPSCRPPKSIASSPSCAHRRASPLMPKSCRKPTTSGTTSCRKLNAASAPISTCEWPNGDS